MEKKKTSGRRPKRVRLSREEIIKRMKELPLRKDKIIAAVRKSEN